MIATILLAASLTYSGTFGQSAEVGSAPVTLFGIDTCGESPDGHVYFASQQHLYTVDRDTLIDVGSIDFCSPSLESDGSNLWILCEAYYGMQKLGTDPKTGKFKVLKRYANPYQSKSSGAITVRPADPNHPFASVGKFFVVDKTRNMIVALDEDGKNPTDFAPYPHVGTVSTINGLGFLPETGQLCAVTYFSDTRIYRFNPDGTRDDTSGWPIHRGYGHLVVRGGILRHIDNNANIYEVHPSYTAANTKKITVGPDSVGGYAVDSHTGYSYVATKQGILYARPGETELCHRLGGIPKPTSILLDHGEVLFCHNISYGGVGYFRVNDGPDSPLAGSHDLRNMYSWNADNRATALSPFADRYIASIGKAGIARFTYFSNVDNKNNQAKFNDFVFSPALPEITRARAVSADTSSREIFFAADEMLFRADYPIVEPKVLKVPLEIRQVTPAPVPGAIHHLARPAGSTSVGFATAATFGAFSSRTEKLLWSQTPGVEVRGIAAVDRRTFAVTTADGVALYSVDGKRLAALDLATVPGGLDPDFAAAEYPWVVVYDRTNYRFVRLEVTASPNGGLLIR